MASPPLRGTSLALLSISASLRLHTTLEAKQTPRRRLHPSGPPGHDITHRSFTESCPHEPSAPTNYEVHFAGLTPALRAASGWLSPLALRFAEEPCGQLSSAAGIDLSARRIVEKSLLPVDNHSAIATSKVWHRLLAAHLRLRVKGRSCQNHFDSERVAGCPAPPCSASWVHPRPLWYREMSPSSNHRISGNGCAEEGVAIAERISSALVRGM